MNNAFNSRPNTGSLRRTKPPGDAEFQALFQLFPGAGLLLDAVREQVVTANSTYLQLTAFALTEVCGRGLREVVGNLPFHPLTAEDSLPVLLERRNRPAVVSTMQVRAIDPAGQWLALFFQPEEDPRKNLANRMDSILTALVELNRWPDDEMPMQILERAMGVIRELLNADAVALYRVNSQDSFVWKSVEAGEKELLPENIPASDFLKLENTIIWKPGRRVQTELHRDARVKNLAYLASTRTSQNGLLVIAERRHEPADPLAMLLDALGRQISAILDHLAREGELRQRDALNNREINILRAVSESTQEGILILAPDQTVSQMNPAAEWMLGYADWEVKGQPVENILIGPERLGPGLAMAAQGISTHNLGIVSLHRRNGQVFPAQIQIIPVQNEGETQAVIVFFSDASENIEIRNRTQQLEQRAVLGEVTAVFAHEVRNPINNISTGLQLLSSKLSPEDPSQENINRLLNDCVRLNHLMESVLNFSRQTEHKFEAVNLETFLQRLLDRWRPRMAKVNVVPFFQIEPGTPAVMGDPRSLEQVFTNLISNAVDAMSKQGGTLAVRVAPFQVLPARPQVEVTVSDNGPGIPDEVRGRIFEPFVTTKPQGTGLGLAITKRIVTAHHGSITVNSFPGGTVFHVLLSAAQGETA
jgi:two-component system, NtrC family, sensor histidine kinase AtoS